MLFNLVVVAVVLLVAYMWTAQGFFSALIHLLCTLAAGAIAFAVWEPLVYGLLLNATPTLAWTVGLVVPFIVALGVLRVATDKLVTRDIKVPGALDFAGGGLAGAGSGVISMGILVIGVGFMPVGATFMGHRRVEPDSGGSLVRTNALWAPVDTLTARLYESLSTGAFTAGNSSLARRMPDVADQSSMIRATYNDRGMTALKPSSFELAGTYIVEAPTLDELTTDGFNPRPDGSDWPQDVTRVDGSAPAPTSVIRGYTVRFLDGAAEKSGQIIVGPGSARLICELSDGTSEGFQPIAVVAQSSGKDIAASRYRFNSAGVFIGHASSSKNPAMSFEFVVPADAQPIDLLMKQVRVNLADAPAPRTYSVDERDDAIFSLDLIARSEDSSGGARPSASTIASRATGGGEGAIDGLDASDAGVRMTNTLSNLTLSRQMRGSLTVNDENLIVSGNHSFAADDIIGVKVPQSLKVTGFDVRPGLTMIQADVSLNRRLSLLGRAASAAEKLLPPVLTDSNSQVYEAVGYIFIAGDRVEVRYEPGTPVRALSELPSLSASRPGDRLVLLFQVTKGVEITSFTLGQQVEVATFEPPLLVNR